jgi:glycosyltransferase involved in cell wall biosynthesis
MKFKSTLLYAANLHVGGGIQVATSVIAEMLDLRKDDQDGMTIWASTSVHNSLESIGIDTTKILRYKVVNHRGLGAIFSGDRVQMDKFSCVFVIFGPLYIPLLRAFRLVGFAQPWIIYPCTDAYRLISRFRRITTRFKFWLQAQAFRNADHLIVELEHVRKGLIESGVARGLPVNIVSNCVGSIFTQNQIQQVQPMFARDKQLTLGFLGRNYTHKNTIILSQIRKLLRERYQLSVRMLVTFTDEEWESCTGEFRDEVVNVGAISVVQCPSFYRSLDGLIFPSLLECFSATPLEALAMEVPLFASDRPFVRDVCLDFAEYFDPHSPENAADKIYKFYQAPLNIDRLRKGREYVLNFSSPKERVLSYLKIIQANVKV